MTSAVHALPTSGHKQTWHSCQVCLCPEAGKGSSLCQQKKGVSVGVVEAGKYQLRNFITPLLTFSWSLHSCLYNAFFLLSYSLRVLYSQSCYRLSASDIFRKSFKSICSHFLSVWMWAALARNDYWSGAKRCVLNLFLLTSWCWCWDKEPVQIWAL